MGLCTSRSLVLSNVDRDFVTQDRPVTDPTVRWGSFCGGSYKTFLGSPRSSLLDCSVWMHVYKRIRIFSTGHRSLVEIQTEGSRARPVSWCGRPRLSARHAHLDWCVALMHCRNAYCGIEIPWSSKLPRTPVRDAQACALSLRGSFFLLVSWTNEITLVDFLF